MFLARLFIFGVPLAAAGLTWWSVKQARASRVMHADEVVAMLPGAPPALHPFLPATELDRQLIDLTHEPLIRIGPDGKLKPVLAERWDWSETMACWFVKDDLAAKATEHLQKAGTEKWSEWGLAAVDAKGGEVVMRFAKMTSAGPDQVMREIASFDPLPAEIVRVELREAARPYHEHFLANAIEAAQVRRTWFDGDSAYEMIVAGDTAKFLQEITNYYNAKTNLQPRVIALDRIPALREPVLEITMREGMRWHDGTPVTAADAVATYQMVMAQPWPVPNRDALRQVQSIDLVSASKFRATLRRRYGPAICGWVNLPILPAAWLKENAPDAEGRVFTTATPPGAGRFVITHRNLSSLALAPASDGARARRLSFLSGASPFKTRLGFATGAVDMFWPGNQEIPALLKDTGLAIRSTAPRSRLLVMWNTRAPVLEDARVREALGLATDRQALIEVLLNGRGRVEDGLFQPALWFAQKFSPTRLDLEAAQKLITDASFLRDVSGVAKRPGQALAFELLVTAGSADRVRLAHLLAEQWKKIGAQVTVTEVPWNELVDGHMATHRFDAVIFGLDFETSWDQFPFWHSSQVENGLNFCGVSDRQIDLLLEELREEFEPERVTAKANELENKVRALHPMLPLFTDMTQVAVRLSALEKGERKDDEREWSLRDLVLDPAMEARAKPKIDMIAPSIETVLPVGVEKK